MATKAQKYIICAMAEGQFLKSHRDLDGMKVFKLHTPSGRTEIVPPNVVRSLRDKGWIESNKKFPVANFWLTEKGHILAAQLKKTPRVNRWIFENSNQ